MTRIAFVSMAALSILGLACNREATPTAIVPVLPAGPAAPVSVKVASPKKQTLSWTIEQPGTVQAFESTPVVAKLSGYVANVHVDLGDAVKGPHGDEPGTLLAEISIPELAEEAKQKKADIELRAAEVLQAKSGATVAAEQVNSSEANGDEAKAMRDRVEADAVRWASELKRIEGLVRSRIVDVQTLDETKKQQQTSLAAKAEVEAKIRSAAALVREAKAKKSRAEADVAAAEAKRKVAEAEASRVDALVAYTKIRAPYDGIVTGRFVHTGHFLQPSNGRLDPLFTLAKLATVRIIVDVPDSLAAQAKAGTKAKVKFPSLAGREVDATIARASGAINADNRTLRVEIDLPNPDGLWKPGTYCTVQVQASSADTWTLPGGSVLVADETTYGFLIADGKVEKQRLRVGRTQGGSVEVLARQKATTPSAPWLPLTGAEPFAVGQLGALIEGQAVQIEQSSK